MSPIKPPETAYQATKATFKVALLRQKDHSLDHKCATLPSHKRKVQGHKASLYQTTRTPIRPRGSPFDCKSPLLDNKGAFLETGERAQLLPVRPKHLVIWAPDWPTDGPAGILACGERARFERAPFSGHTLGVGWPFWAVD